MKKLNNSDFELLENIIKNIEFDYNKENNEKINKIRDCWNELTGKKISELTKVEKISDNDVIIILCADSFVANELYLSKTKLIEILGKKTREAGITIRDIKFDYKKWKDKTNE